MEDPVAHGLRLGFGQCTLEQTIWLQARSAPGLEQTIWLQARSAPAIRLVATQARTRSSWSRLSSHGIRPPCGVPVGLSGRRDDEVRIKGPESFNQTVSGNRQLSC